MKAYEINTLLCTLILCMTKFTSGLKVTVYNRLVHVHTCNFFAIQNVAPYLTILAELEQTLYTV